LGAVRGLYVQHNKGVALRQLLSGHDGTRQ
jgi:hypothetical protein